MTSFVSLLRICVLAIAATAVASCGGGGGGGEDDHAPSISNLRYSPSASVQAVGGAASVQVLVDFADSGGDVVSVRLKSGSSFDLTVPISNVGGVKSGTSAATFQVPLQTVGMYIFETWLVDSQGQASNHLSGTFEVLAKETTPHPPSISNLRYSPETAVQAVGGTTSIVGSVDFADVAGDVAALHLATTAGVDLTVPLSNLNGIKSGTATGNFIVASDTIGKYPFEIWVVDGKGSASNRLSGSFEVLAATPPRDPPTVANLRYSPATAVQSASGTVSINVSLDFADSGANIASARFMSSAGPDLTVPVTTGSGLASGTATATFVVSAASLGAFTFQVWLIDSKGDLSNGLSGSFEVLPSGGSSTWTKLSASPPAELLGIGSNGGLYVAVGVSGTVMTSPDLASWSVRSTGVTHTLRSVALSASKAVAVGDNASGESIVLTSNDGASWTATYRSIDCAGVPCASVSQLSKVIWTGTKFVAVGMERLAGAQMFHALVLTSPDGVAWTKRAPQTIALSDEFYGPQMRWVSSIAWSGSTFVLMAIDVNWDPVVWTSTDAQVWTLASGGLPTTVVWAGPLTDVTWANGRFVTVDMSGWHGGAPVFASVDGVSWEVDRNTDDLPQMNAVTAKNGEFLAVGDSYKETSTDGLTWTVSSHPAGCGNAVLWDGNRYVSVGASICKSQ